MADLKPATRGQLAEQVLRAFSCPDCNPAVVAHVCDDGHSPLHLIHSVTCPTRKSPAAAELPLCNEHHPTETFLHTMEVGGRPKTRKAKAVRAPVVCGRRGKHTTHRGYGAAMCLIEWTDK